MTMQDCDVHADEPNVLETGIVGPVFGSVDIGVSKKAYIFRVILAGAKRDPSTLRCCISQDGTVLIEGVISEERLLKKSTSTYLTHHEQLSPPGPFTISFCLPGPVDPRLFSPKFLPNGVLEIVVMKATVPNTCSNGQFVFST